MWTAWLPVQIVVAIAHAQAPSALASPGNAPEARAGTIAYSDPLLEPPASAPQQIASWEQAKGLIERRQPTLGKSLATLEQAEAGAKRALALLLPQLQASAGAEYNTGRANSFTSIAGDLVPGASISLANTFSLSNLRAHHAASAGAEAERIGVSATRHALLGVLSSTLLAVVAAERVAERNRAGLKSALDRLHMTQRLVELGRATALDVARFAQDLYEAQSAVVSGDEALWQAREAFGNALGLGEPAGVAPSFEPSLFVGEPRLAGCAQLDALSERADLRAASRRERRAELSVSAARLAYLPELQLNAGYSAIHAPLASQTEADWVQNLSITASVAFKAFDGGERRSNVQAARAGLSDSRAEQRALEIAAQTESRRAQRAVVVAQANLEIGVHNLEAARQADSLSQRAFELGNASALEGVDAARRLRTAEITLALRGVELVDARVRAQMALAQCR